MVRRLWAEAIGTAILMATATGCAAMTAGLTEDAALALAICALSAGAALFVSITLFTPVSGGHLNPAVTLAFALRGEIRAGAALLYVLAQAAGAIAGAVLAHAMFALPLVELSTIARAEPRLWLSEAVATCGLILVIAGGIAARGPVPALVGTFVAMGYFFTASSAFTNPAMTLARTLTGTAAGLRPEDLLPYLLAQGAGAVLGALLGRGLFGQGKTPDLADGG